MFGSSNNNSDEIGRLWERLVPVEKSVTKQDKLIEKQRLNIDTLTEKCKQPSESQASAETSARSARAHNSNIKKIKAEIIEDKNSIEDLKSNLSLINDQLLDAKNSLNALIDETQKTLNEANDTKNESRKVYEEMIESFNEIKEISDENEDLAEKVELLNSQIIEIEENDSKAQGLLKTIVTTHIKVRDIKNEIFGYEEEGEDGELEKVDGLKDELEQSYTSIKSDFKEHIDTFNESKLNLEKELDTLKNDTEIKVNDFFDTHKVKYEDTLLEIRTLLPGAMTAGLSTAYNDKVKVEDGLLNTYQTNFNRAILGLVVISLIPFFVDLYLLLGMSKSIVEVISDTPKLLISILPLYFPILWLAYSANKKMNLSKRLIEEYTHKGVLSKTFEGLSGQIEKLGDGDISSELQVKLLFNLLHVNSENPGKLISDYKTTDHPLFDALDKSVKLSDAVEKLKNIPGFSKLASKLDEQSKEILASTNRKSSESIEKAFDKDHENKIA
jgi:hypothetical protein